ncbi:MAG: hypothetical protein H8E54_10075 [Candidatus Aminicenantes bacterium]|nr:hypothetical protein [Candidatus Aminicenantes bacterium]
MFKCRIIDFFFFIFPLKRWRDFLIRHHVQKCSVCQEKLAGVEDVKSFLFQESDVGDMVEIWPVVKEELEEEKSREQRAVKPRLRWAVGLASLFVAAVVVVGLYFTLSSKKGPSMGDLQERFQINYISIENKPAKTYIYRPGDSNMIIVWAEKNI